MLWMLWWNLIAASFFLVIRDRRTSLTRRREQTRNLFPRMSGRIAESGRPDPDAGQFWPNLSPAILERAVENLRANEIVCGLIVELEFRKAPERLAGRTRQYNLAPLVLDHEALERDGDEMAARFQETADLKNSGGRQIADQDEVGDRADPLFPFIEDLAALHPAGAIAVLEGRHVGRHEHRLLRTRGCTWRDQSCEGEHCGSEIPNISSHGRTSLRRQRRLPTGGCLFPIEE